MRYAPIAVFAFKRKDPLQSVLRDLAACPEARESSLYVFCDGPRNEGEGGDVEAARKVAREARGFASVEVREAPANRGLAASIIAGVSEMCERHGRVIVVEDDLLLSPDFLAFMNGGLDRYRDDPRVFQVGGHMWDVPVPEDASACFLTFTTSWGWATWLDRWKRVDFDAKTLCDRIAALPDGTFRFDVSGSYPFFDMLKLVHEGKINSWAVRFNAACFLEDGLVLYPARSLASHNGHDDAATHGRATHYITARPSRLRLPYRWPPVMVDAKALGAIAEHFRSHLGAHRAASERISIRLSQRIGRAISHFTKGR